MSQEQHICKNGDQEISATALIHTNPIHLCKTHEKNDQNLNNYESSNSSSLYHEINKSDSSTNNVLKRKIEDMSQEDDAKEDVLMILCKKQTALIILLRVVDFIMYHWTVRS